MAGLLFGDDEWERELLGPARPATMRRASSFSSQDESGVSSARPVSSTTRRWSLDIPLLQSSGLSAAIRKLKFLTIHLRRKTETPVLVLDM